MVSGREPAALVVRALLAQGRQADLAQSGPDRPTRTRPRRRLAEDAERLASGIAERLGLETDYVIPAFEDPAHWLLQEAKLPPNVDAAAISKLEDAEERARIARVFERGLATPGRLRAAGAALERRRRRRWVSEHWALRRERLFLMPGDSPVGFRLPLASLPWVAPAAYPYVVPADPVEPQGALPDPEALHQRVVRAGGACPRRPTGASRSARSHRPPATPTRCAPRSRSSRATAASACSCRRSETLEDYLELIACVERTAEDLGLPVHVEGYPPPVDPRLEVMKVTPDPGVIEVNVQPAASWRECVEITRELYEDARLARLGTDKFMIDGRHTGTGGGNHVVIGGATPADSPFLRRPDLLKSLIVYWQRHPALSYLFSGLFIGPTSQAPRIDEARHDSLYELEIALANIPAPGGGRIPLWLVDRLLRNLLVDVHRQHPPHRDLHRQAVLARRPDRPARPRRVPLLRDAARLAHEPRPAAAAAGADRLVLARAAGGPAGALGHRAARPLHAAPFRVGGLPRRARRPRAAPATRSSPRGSPPSASSASRSTAGSSTAACGWSCARRWSPGT